MADLELINKYKSIVGNAPDFSLTIPAFSPNPTPEDYTFGQITRYFARQSNNRLGEIIEISEQTFNSLAGRVFYITVSLPWRITGSDTNKYDANGIRVVTSISVSNKHAISIAEQTIPGISNKLVNVYQFWLGK